MDVNRFDSTAYKNDKTNFAIPHLKLNPTNIRAHQRSAVFLQEINFKN